MMRYVVLATDYDGTLASQGRVEANVVAALERFRREGRTLILVTGRELDELLGIFPEVSLFHRVVAENGGLLYCPQSGRQRVLGEPPSPEFIATLVGRGVHPLSVGRSIVATFEPHESTVLASIRDLGLELQVIFNKGAVMVLPAGVNKATGLAHALVDLGLSMRNVVAIGDAENDHAMLRASEFGVAVGNALPALKEEADYTSALCHGDAVVEVMVSMLRDDLSRLPAKRERRPLRLGMLADGTPLVLSKGCPELLLTGRDRGCVRTYLAALVEQLIGYGYQSCIFDCGHSLVRSRGTITLGTSTHSPTVEEVRAALLDTSIESVVVDLEGQSPRVRDPFVASLYQECVNLRHTHGRPHWCVFVDVPRPSILQASFDRDADAFGIIYAEVDQDAVDWSRVRSQFSATVALGPDSIRRLCAEVGGADAACALPGGEAAFWSSLPDNPVIGFAPNFPSP